MANLIFNLKNLRRQAESLETRELEAKDFESEIKWYTDKFCMKMEGSTAETTRDWICGIGYGADFAEELYSKIEAVTYMENNFVRINWSLTEF